MMLPAKLTKTLPLILAAAAGLFLAGPVMARDAVGSQQPASAVST